MDYKVIGRTLQKATDIYTDEPDQMQCVTHPASTNHVTLPDSDELVGSMSCPVTPQINWVSKIITFGCKFF